MQNQAIQNRQPAITIPRATATRRVWLRVGTLIDGDTKLPLRNPHVVYDAASILYVGEEKHPPPPTLVNPEQSHPDLELPEFTLLPGLIEAHSHMILEGSELNSKQRANNSKKPHADLLEGSRRKLERLVSLGIVGVRDAGDKMGIGLSLSKIYSSPERRLMPYIDSPGAAIHHRGEYGSFMSEPVENFGSPRECIQSRIDGGAERIKLISSDVIDFKTGRVVKEPQMTAGEVRDFVTIAREFKRQTFAHATGDRGIENVIEGGVDSVEHGFFIRDDQLERMRDRQIAWVPTFAPVQKQIDYADVMGWNDKIVSQLRNILDRHSASLLKAEALGVPVLAGSDAGAPGVPHGIGLIDELCLMERAGLSSIAVLRCATGNSSRLLQFKERFGLVKPGYQSRFILTRYSPLEGVENLRKKKYVVFDGEVYNRSEPVNIEGL
ncbi:MAG: amidohydrolase family protein [Bacteroidota bacterium]